MTPSGRGQGSVHTCALHTHEHTPINTHIPTHYAHTNTPHTYIHIYKYQPMYEHVHTHEQVPTNTHHTQNTHKHMNTYTGMNTHYTHTCT